MNNQPIDLNLLCQEKITEAHNIIMTPRGDYERAIEILTRLLNDLKPIIDNSTVSYSFNDDLESIIFYNRFAESNKIIEEEYPLALIHYYIALAHSAENANDEAIAELKIATRMNPFFMDAWVKKAELHEVNNEHDMMYQTITEAYNFIIDAQALSKFYIILGKYYMFLKNYQLANILISYSTYFNRNSRSEERRVGKEC